jgi:hypothetical protein
MRKDGLDMLDGMVLDSAGPGSLVMGEFNSEKFWQSSNTAKLPDIPDRSSRNIILSMDELLFSFCNSGDLLITRFKFNDGLKSYLKVLGWSFMVNSQDIQSSAVENGQSIFEILCQNKERIDDIPPELLEKRRFSPYSLIPHCDTLARELNLDFQGPPLEVVREVNSKAYSCRLSRKLGMENSGEVVDSSRALLMKGGKLLKNGAFLIKDPYGVSGKGNILIHTAALLERIVGYLEGQEKKGFICIFVIEPFLEKTKDFSCGLTIDTTGKLEIISVQEMVNHNFAYGGSYTADPPFLEYLEREKYFETIADIAKALYQDGYFGTVCVDSMVLKNQALRPVVEINARQSMGLINHRIDRYLSRFGLKGNLTFLNLGYRRGLDFEGILAAIDAEGLLFYPGKERGVMLLSANTLFANEQFQGREVAATDAIYQGRIYLSVIAADHEGRNLLVRKLRSVFHSISCAIYN